MEVMIQSNSIRDKAAHEIVAKTVGEILNDTRSLLGPGATDAFIVKNNASYYTRDGMEVMESLLFDNELASYVHHIMFQASYNQGKKVGDGTTTLEVLYCYLYLILRDAIDNQRPVASLSINEVRRIWGEMIEFINVKLDEKKTTLDGEQLKSMLLTCTQDRELAAKIYTQLKEPLLAGAYIVPRPSNIQDDFAVTSYTRPTFHATRQYALKPVDDKMSHAVLYYCYGNMDISHWEVLFELVTTELSYNDIKCDDLSIVLLCHGTSDRTRATLKEFNRKIREYGIDLNSINNLVIYTLDDYRTFSREEIEDIVTIITEEPTVNGMVNALTFENLLYRSFFVPNSIQRSDGTFIDTIEDLDVFDGDMHFVERVKDLFQKPFCITVDDVEGISLDKPLGPSAQMRYDALLKQIKDEKSEIKQVELSKRMRRVYGMFIDIEIGSALLKDSQRKYELVLDAIISAAEGVRYGVLEGNSILWAIKVLNDFDDSSDAAVGDLKNILMEALVFTVSDLINNCGRNDLDYLRTTIANMATCTSGDYDISDFNLTGDNYLFWPEKDKADTIREENGGILYPSVTYHLDGQDVVIQNKVIEPVTIIKSILTNSITPLELAWTKVFHIAGNRGYMNNFIQDPVI